jgi:hypothetical protein
VDIPKGFVSGQCAGQAVGPPCPIHCAKKYAVQKFSNSEKKLWWSTIWHDPQMNPCLQIHILQQLWKKF